METQPSSSSEQALPEELIRKFKILHHGREKLEDLFLLTLYEVEEAILLGNVDNFRRFGNFIRHANVIENSLKHYYCNPNEADNYHSNLIILSCKYDHLKILEHLFGPNGDLLQLSSIDVLRCYDAVPQSKDSENHTAFYYAIRSGNVKLLETLIEKWPKDYFSIHRKELEELLSCAYEELKLKNIELENKMIIYVENKLLELRLFDVDSIQYLNCKQSLVTISERITLVLHNIDLLITDSNTLNGQFLYIANFVAKNIHILKKHLKSSYERLPWEEIEFCLISFISCYTKKLEINIFYRSVLDRPKLLHYLRLFSNKLEAEQNKLVCMGTYEISRLPELERKQIVEKIIQSSPEFEDLYIDFRQNRDIYSLLKINEYKNLLLSSKPDKKSGRLVMIKSLQGIGEFLKNTLLHPNLSDSISELIILTIPKKTREIILTFYNAITHIDTLSERMELEENTNVHFFTLIQREIENVVDVLNDIIYDRKIKALRYFIDKITTEDPVEDLRDLSDIINHADIDYLCLTNFKPLEFKQIKKLFQELTSLTTKYETQLFNDIQSIFNFDNNSEEEETDVINNFELLKVLVIDPNITSRFIKAAKDLKIQISCEEMKKIVEFVTKFARSIKMYNEEANKLTCHIFYLAEIVTNDSKWIKQFKYRFSENGSFLHPYYKKRKISKNTDPNLQKQLPQRIKELKTILTNNCLLQDQLSENLPFYIVNKNLKTLLEITVLDILSISYRYFQDDLFYLDDNVPILNGKSLFNHLEHEAPLNDNLLFHPVLSVVLNAIKITQTKNFNENLGQFLKNDLCKVSFYHIEFLNSIINQERMFEALKNGNLKALKYTLKNGADIQAVDIHSKTSLHYAAQNPSLEIVKFVYNHQSNIRSKSANSQSALHVAANYGRTNIVLYLLEELNFCVDDIDVHKKTPLHLAAQHGHSESVRILLRNQANRYAVDVNNCLPINYAIRNDYIDVIKILLEEDTSIDSAFLHEAAENGHTEIVQYLIDKGVNIDGTTEKLWTPLHAASANGYTEVVNVLLENGANINAISAKGLTPIIYAIKSGYEDIAEILLQPNASSTNVNELILHYAAKYGLESIVQILLENNTNVNNVGDSGTTPLHLAVENGNIKTVMVLLEHGADVHAKDNTNATPLYYAAANDHTKIVEILVQNGSYVNAKAVDNKTALHMAASEGHEVIAEFLLRKNANVNVLTVNSETPLHKAAVNGSVEVVNLLIGYKSKLNARTINGLTALHIAAIQGHKDVMTTLIKNRAEINVRDKYDLTPFHAAVTHERKDIVLFLLENNANINATNVTGYTPLHVAIENCKYDIVELLIEKGANINTTPRFKQPLVLAIENNRKDIVELLIKNGANIFEPKRNPLLFAVLLGFQDIAKILITNQADVRQIFQNLPLLLWAVKKGLTDIVHRLLCNGAAISDVDGAQRTSLHLAIQNKFEDIVELLINNGAKVNAQTHNGETPLHEAVLTGNNNIVKILIDNKANVNVKDDSGLTPLELAVTCGNLKLVKMLFMSCKRINTNAKGNDGWTLLHRAAQSNNLELVKYLVNQGADINAKNLSGSKPIHIAARECFTDLIIYFLEQGMSVNEFSENKQTLLHYAAIKGQLDFVKYLITEGVDINPTDTRGTTPMHIASYMGHKKIVDVLLQNGAVYNSVDTDGNTPLSFSKDKHIIKLLSSIDQLFKAVKRNDVSEVERLVKTVTLINTKDTQYATPLQYAVCEGYEQIVSVLLFRKADPNISNVDGMTPLHFAAVYSHLNIVKMLLTFGAIYDCTAHNGMTALEVAQEDDIKIVLEMIDKTFKNVKSNNVHIIKEINEITDVGILKAIIGTKNKHQQTLMDVATQVNFLRTDNLKEISQCNVYGKIQNALCLLHQGQHEKSLNIFQEIFENRKHIMGSNNLDTLEIQEYIAKALFAMGTYEEALNILEAIFNKKKEQIGEVDSSTLSTRRLMAIIFSKQEKLEEALNIYREVYEKQKNTLGLLHSDTLDSCFRMIMTLIQLGKHEEAIRINKEVYQKRKELSGENNQEAIKALCNYANVLANHKKHEKTMEIYNEAENSGSDQSNTLKIVYNIATLLFDQKQYVEAVQVYEELLSLQKNVLGPTHQDTLLTKYCLGNVLYAQCKFNEARKLYLELIPVLGPNHSDVVDMTMKLEAIELTLQFDDSEFFQNPQHNIHISAAEGDIPAILDLLNNGSDLDERDSSGKTPLHYATYNGQTNTVKFLLKRGADVTKITHKGNTMLHIAMLKDNFEIFEILLTHIDDNLLHDCINLITTASGTSVLHVAAKKGYLDIVKSLLKIGAVYEIKNMEDKTPLEVSTEQNVCDLLRRIDEYFADAVAGNFKLIGKLQLLSSDEWIAIINCRNSQDYTILEVAIMNNNFTLVHGLHVFLEKNFL